VDDSPTGERDVLVDVAGRAQEVADLVEGSTEAMGRIEVLEAAHRPIAPFHPSVILFQHVVFILTGAVVDVRAEFVGEGPGIAGMAVGGDLLGSTWGFCQVSRQPTRCSGSSTSMRYQPLWF
jgi:hypothetical protein